MLSLSHVRAALQSALDEEVGALTSSSVSGGCINEAATVTDGRTRWFVKHNDRPLPDQFAAEAAGLEAMIAARSGLTIPAPIAWADDGPGRSFLVLEQLDIGRRAAATYDEALGRGLAALHRSSSSRGFGFSRDGYCGATPQPNGWLPNWVEFYVERRLAHQLRLCRDRGLSRSEAEPVERLIARLPEILDDDDPPALIHGDLWGGNRDVGPSGEPVIYDPAAYYAHREAELGMMVLFGGFSEAVFAAYDEAWPLRDGWRDRVDVYTLYHVMNHYTLFGGGYGAQASRLASRIE